MDRGQSNGEISGVAPPPPSRDKDNGDVQVTLQVPGRDDLDSVDTRQSVSVRFTSPWKEKRGSVAAFGDASKNQDAFVTLRTVSPGAVGSARGGVADLPQALLLNAVFGRDSRFGTYGAPTNIKVLSDSLKAGDDGLRILDISFTTQGAQLEVDKHVLIGSRLVTPRGGEAPVMALLVAGSSKAKWGDSKDDARVMVESLKVK